MRTPTLADAGGATTQIPPARHQPLDPGEEFHTLWAMTRDERIAAMWRGELTTRQLCQWSSRAQHEVPLLGGEFAWIVMRTPEWAEAATAGTDRTRQKGGVMATLTASPQRQTYRDATTSQARESRALLRASKRASRPRCAASRTPASHRREDRDPSCSVNS